MRCHQISSVAVSVELTEFLDKIFQMHIFKPKFNFFEILIANMAKNSKRVMPIQILFSDILISRGQNHEIFIFEKVGCQMIAI